MIRSNKLKSHIFFYSREVTWQIKKCYIWIFMRPWLLNLKWWWVMSRSHYPQWSHDTIFAWWWKTLYFCSYMARDCQTHHGDGLWYLATMHKVTWFSTTWSCVIPHDNSNSTSPMDTKCDKVVAYDQYSKNHIILSKKFFPFKDFFYLTI